MSTTIYDEPGAYPTTLEQHVMGTLFKPRPLFAEDGSRLKSPKPEPDKTNVGTLFFYEPNAKVLAARAEFIGGPPGALFPVPLVMLRAAGWTATDMGMRALPRPQAPAPPGSGGPQGGRGPNGMPPALRR
jgi:hypothetical protein